MVVGGRLRVSKIEDKGEAGIHYVLEGQLVGERYRVTMSVVTNPTHRPKWSISEDVTVEVNTDSQ